MKDKDIRLLYEIYNSTNAFGIGIRKEYKEALMNAIESLKNEPFLIDALHKAHEEIKEMKRQIYNEGYSQGYIDGSTGADWRGDEE